MSDLDVALRLRLVNQLSGPAEQAERDLKELQQAAERLAGRAAATSSARKSARSALQPPARKPTSLRSAQRPISCAAPSAG